MSVNRPCFKKIFPPNDQTRIFFAATAPYFEARKIQRNGPMWTKANLPNHGMGNRKPNQSTCLLGLRAVFCIFATLCGAHVKRSQKHNDSAKKKARKVFQFAFSQGYGKIRHFFTKIRHFFTFFSLFIFGFPLIFEKNVYTGENLKNMNFCPWIPGIFLCNFQPLLPSWSMDQDPCCTAGKNQQIAVMGQNNPDPKVAWQDVHVGKLCCIHKCE